MNTPNERSDSVPATPVLAIGEKQITIPVWLIPLLLSAFPAFGGYMLLNYQQAELSKRVGTLEDVTHTHVRELDHPRSIVAHVQRLEADVKTDRKNADTHMREFERLLNASVQNQIRICDKLHINCVRGGQ